MRQITMHGNTLALTGRDTVSGRPAPDFIVSSQELKDVRLGDFKGKIKLISSFPSLDTPVCDLQVKEFNKRAAGLSEDVAVIGISMDLPFAQKRFCSENSIQNEAVLSDYRTASFGLNYGLLIKELRLLARAVVIVDTADALRYIQVVPELTAAVNFDQVISALQEVVKTPQIKTEAALPSHCAPCIAGTHFLSKEKVEKLIAGYRGWQVVEDKKIVKEFTFKDFNQAKYFLDIVAVLAEEQGHHPAMTLTWGKVKITLTTHAAGGLTENDFIMARIIDEVS